MFLSENLHVFLNEYSCNRQRATLAASARWARLNGYQFFGILRDLFSNRFDLVHDVYERRKARTLLGCVWHSTV